VLYKTAPERTSFAMSATVLRLVLVLFATITLFALVRQYHTKMHQRDLGALPPTGVEEGFQYPPAEGGAAGAPVGASFAASDTAPVVAAPTAPLVTTPGCAPKADRLTAQDLLPKDAANSVWAQSVPAGTGDVSDKNFLNAGYHIGSQSTTLRNANLQIRSEPPNPRANVGPWLQSTIEFNDQRALE
jgi:hypothetical protein